MPTKEAAALFDASREPLGGVVVGEAYRVDQDPSAMRKAFDPRDRSTWGKGGKAPLLDFDLGWGGTHGLVFAGSGSYKTVSTCVPTLLTYRGPTVTLDPSSELAPMLTPARIAMGRRVICIDPASRDGAFNALDWLNPASPLIDGDIRAVVDWICGGAREFLAHGLLGQSEAGGEGDEVALGVGEIGIEDDVGEERLDHSLAAAFEEGLAGVGRVAGRGSLLAANPVDDGADIAVDERGGGVEPVEGVEGAVAAGGIDADDAAAHGDACRRQHGGQLG